MPVWPKEVPGKIALGSVFLSLVFHCQKDKQLQKDLKPWAQAFFSGFLLSDALFSLENASVSGYFAC